MCHPTVTISNAYRLGIYNVTHALYAYTRSIAPNRAREREIDTWSEIESHRIAATVIYCIHMGIQRAWYKLST